MFKVNNKDARTRSSGSLFSSLDVLVIVLLLTLVTVYGWQRAPNPLFYEESFPLFNPLPSFLVLRSLIK